MSDNLAPAVAERFAMIRRAIDCGRPAQAYLVTGSVRGAALDLALQIAQYLFCESEAKPCGVCGTCGQIARRVFADVHWFFPEKKSRIFSVEQVRESLLPVVQQTSLFGGWKVVVVVGADRLKEAAANALLKTLEEPSPETLFLLLSDASQEILPTIVSRCQRIDLQDVRDLAEPWRSGVLQILSSDRLGSSVMRIAAAADLVELLGRVKESAEKAVAAESESETESVQEDDEVFDAKVSARYREERANFLMTLNRWFRDLLVMVSGGSDRVLFYPEFEQVYRARAVNLSLAQALLNLERVERIAKQLNSNLPESAVLPYWLDRLSHGVKG